MESYIGIKHDLNIMRINSSAKLYTKFIKVIKN